MNALRRLEQGGIRTRIGEGGGAIPEGEFVEKIDRLTRARRMELLDEQLVYEARQLDRDVVSESQIRTVIRHVRDALFTELFPHRPERIVPKTLIFAKDDNHADNIVRIAREEFGKGNDFCQKITYRAQRNTEEILKDFCNSYNPRVAVTVAVPAVAHLVTEAAPVGELLHFQACCQLAHCLP